MLPRQPLKLVCLPFHHLGVTSVLGEGVEPSWVLPRQTLNLVRLPDSPPERILLRMLPFIIALAWAPVSFILHCFLHELAHGLVAVASGSRIEKLWPFPSRRLGYFTWAYVQFSRLPDLKNYPLLLSAPLIVEFGWLLLCWGLLLIPVRVLQAVLLVEMISAIVDSTTWLLGWWNPRVNMNCDAEVFRTTVGMSRLKGKMLSLLYLLPISFSLFLLIRFFSTGGGD